MTRPTPAAPLLLSADAVQCHRISATDTVKLAVLAGPDTGSPTTVVFEVWEPGGSQPPNSHPDSAETFVVLSGSGIAYSDAHEEPLAPGDTITLMPGSVHRIVNTSPTARLYTLTIMHVDGGFAKLIQRGPAAELDEADLDVLRGRFGG